MSLIRTMVGARQLTVDTVTLDHVGFVTIINVNFTEDPEFAEDHIDVDLSTHNDDGKKHDDIVVDPVVIPMLQ